MRSAITFVSSSTRKTNSAPAAPHSAAAAQTIPGRRGAAMGTDHGWRPRRRRRAGSRSHLETSTGNRVSVRNAMMSMLPAQITPSSETPLYSVGRKARKPTAVVSAQSTSALPVERAAQSNASWTPAPRRSSCTTCMPRWIMKSTPNPMKSTAHAIDTGLSFTTVAAAYPAEQTRPVTSVAAVAATTTSERNATKSTPITSRSENPPARPVSRARPRNSS